MESSIRTTQNESAPQCLKYIIVKKHQNKYRKMVTFVEFGYVLVTLFSAFSGITEICNAEKRRD